MHSQALQTYTQSKHDPKTSAEILGTAQPLTQAIGADDDIETQSIGQPNSGLPGITASKDNPQVNGEPRKIIEPALSDDDEVKPQPQTRTAKHAESQNAIAPTSRTQGAHLGAKRPRGNEETDNMSIDAKIAKLTGLAERKAAKYVEDLRDSLFQLQHAELNKWLEAVEREED